MSKKEKQRTQFLHNPTTLQYRQIRQILVEAGFVEIPTKGSHIKWKHPELKRDIVVPIHNNDCKDFYKKQIRDLLKSMYS